MEKTEVYNPVPKSLERMYLHLLKQQELFEKLMLKYDKHNSDLESKKREEKQK